MKLIPTNEIETELAESSQKPPKYALQAVFPLNDLDDRTFELLLYVLATHHASIFPFAYDFCGLSLPGGDKGRDIALYYGSQLSGVVQCKRQKTLIDRTSIGKEILKFVLHCINEGIPLTRDHQINYLFACSTGLNKEAGALVQAFPSSILDDTAILKTWCNELSEKFENLNVSYLTHELAIRQGIESIRVTPVLPIDISVSISIFPEISKTFFELQSVLDSKTFEDIVKGRNLDVPSLLLQYAPSIKNNFSRVNFFGLSLTRRPREIELYALFVAPFFRRRGPQIFYSSQHTDVVPIPSGVWVSKLLEELQGQQLELMMGKGSGKTAVLGAWIQHWRKEASPFPDEKRLPGVVSKSSVSLAELLSHNSNFVVLGRAGAGKSSLIKYAMCKLADRDATVFEHGDILNKIPFRVELNGYNAFRLAHNGGFVAFIANRMQTDNQLAYMSTNNVIALLESYDSIVFFDGLDEVIDPTERAQVRNEIENFARNTPRARVIVTCRPEAYSDVPFKEQDFEVFEVEDFSDVQIVDYVNKWYAIEEPNVALREKEIANCVSELSTVENELRRNPLLLSLILIIYRNNLEFPTTKLEVYESCASTLVDTRDRKEKRIEISLIVQNRIAAFSALAFWQYGLAAERKKEPTYSMVVEFLKDYLMQKGECEDEAKAAEAATEFLEFARVRSLYVENSFSHKTFLEYFTATYVYGNYHTKGKFAERDELLDKRFADSAWNVVVELFLCKIDKEQADYEIIDAIVSRQLERHPKAASAFMLHLLPYLKNISPGLKRSIFRTALSLCIASDGASEMPYRKLVGSRFPPLASDSRFERLCSEVIQEAVSARPNEEQLLLFLLESAIQFPRFAPLIPTEVIPSDTASDPHLFILINFPTLINTETRIDSLVKFNAHFGLRRSLVPYESRFGGRIFGGSSCFSWIPAILFGGDTPREIEASYVRLLNRGYRASMIRTAIEKDTGRLNFESAKVEQCREATRRSDLRMILQTALRQYWGIFVPSDDSKQAFYVKKDPRRRFPIPK